MGRLVLLVSSNATGRNLRISRGPYENRLTPIIPARPELAWPVGSDLGRDDMEPVALLTMASLMAQYPNDAFMNG